MTLDPNLLIGPGPPCHLCGGRYAQHDAWCPYGEKPKYPRRFRVRTTNGKHPTGRDAQYVYGVYFPTTDLCTNEMGGRGTGKPEDVEWLDKEEQ